MSWWTEGAVLGRRMLERHEGSRVSRAGGVRGVPSPSHRTVPDALLRVRVGGVPLAAAFAGAAEVRSPSLVQSQGTAE